MISNTVLKGDTSTRKQPKLNEDLLNYIDSISPANKTYTRGVAVYEMLMLYDNVETEDMISELENRVNSDLDDEVNNISSMIDNIHLSEDERTNINLEQKSQYSIWLPNNISDDLSYSYSSDIINAIEYHASVPFSDRTERITIKKEILEYIQSKQDTETEVDVFSLRPTTQHILLSYDTLTGTDKIHNLLTDIDKKWYHRSDITFSDMETRSDEVKKTKSARIEYLKQYYIKKEKMAKHTARNNEFDEEKIVTNWLPSSKSEVKEDIQKIFDPSKPTLDSYTNTIVDWLSKSK